MTAGEILRQAAALIGQPGAWAQDRYAADSDGRDVWATSTGAACWCMDGALRRVGLGKVAYSTAVDRLIEACTPVPGWTGRDIIHEWNDEAGRTQTECVAKMLEAAEMAEKR